MNEEFDVVVAGAGFAGMYALHRFRGLGLRTRVYETGSGVGGTWYWNRYPGARCDVESIDYSYSFSPELEQDWEWTERFATQPEILRYANHVTDRFDLRRDIRFNTRIESATWDDASSRWDLTLDSGNRISTQFYVMATGCLSHSKLPEVDGLESFEGPTFHTGHWPHEGVDLTGKRVGVIGTGSSGIQSIPVMAEQAAQLTVFQRTANFSMPARNAPLDSEQVMDVKATYPQRREVARMSAGGTPRVIPTKSALEVEAAERDAAFERGWAIGGLAQILSAYKDTGLNRDANATVAEFVRNKIRSIVKDPEVAEILCPTSHPIGTKRPCLDTNYYETFNLDHVELVDLRATPIEAITPTGLRTSVESFEFDVLVFATGFDAMTGALVSVDIKGRDGVTLKEEWAAGPRQYLGLGIVGFPNFFTITGPGSPSVLANMIMAIEQHVDWIAECIDYLRSHGYSRVEATQPAQDQWVDHVNEVANKTLYPDANSWYMGANVPGKPRVFLPYVGGLGVYRTKCDEIAADNYRGFAMR